MQGVLTITKVGENALTEEKRKYEMKLKKDGKNIRYNSNYHNAE